MANQDNHIRNSRWIFFFKMSFKTEEVLSYGREDFFIDHPKDALKILPVSVIFVWKISPRRIEFRKPGAMHPLKLIICLIYSLKIFIFLNNVLSFTDCKLSGLKKVYNKCFGVKLYMKSWFCSHFGIPVQIMTFC